MTALNIITKALSQSVYLEIKGEKHIIQPGYKSTLTLDPGVHTLKFYSFNNTVEPYVISTISILRELDPKVIEGVGAIVLPDDFHEVISVKPEINYKQHIDYIYAKSKVKITYSTAQTITLRPPDDLKAKPKTKKGYSFNKNFNQAKSVFSLTIRPKIVQEIERLQEGQLIVSTPKFLDSVLTPSSLLVEFINTKFKYLLPVLLSHTEANYYQSLAFSQLSKILPIKEAKAFNLGLSEFIPYEIPATQLTTLAFASKAKTFASGLIKNFIPSYLTENNELDSLFKPNSFVDKLKDKLSQPDIMAKELKNKLKQPDIVEEEILKTEVIPAKKVTAPHVTLTQVLANKVHSLQHTLNSESVRDKIQKTNDGEENLKPEENILDKIKYSDTDLSKEIKALGTSQPTDAHHG